MLIETRKIFYCMALFALLVVTPYGSLDGQTSLPVVRQAARVFTPIAALTILNTDLTRLAAEASEYDWSPVGASFEVFEPANAELRHIDEFRHTVNKPVTARRLAAMYKGNVALYKAFNPDLDLDRLAKGDRVLVWRRDPESTSSSVGSPSRGRLVDGVMLPPGAAYRVLFPHRSFGTEFAVSEIVRAMDGFADRYGQIEPMMVGDLSFRKGGRLVPHVSHQSGRDVDISYPRSGAPPNYRRFHPITTRTLKVKESLWLLKSFVEGGQVEYIFVDRRFQRLLREEARRQGAPENWLNAVFQYGGTPGAIIRHAKGHRDHFHVRFRCQEEDSRCL
jgi:murein endopeptidase